MKSIINTLCGMLALASFSAYSLVNLGSLSNSTQLSYIPHAYLSGFTGKNIEGEADVVAPVLLRSNKNLWLVHGICG